MIFNTIPQAVVVAILLLASIVSGDALLFRRDELDEEGSTKPDRARQSMPFFLSAFHQTCHHDSNAMRQVSPLNWERLFSQHHAQAAVSNKVSKHETIEAAACTIKKACENIKTIAKWRRPRTPHTKIMCPSHLTARKLGISIIRESCFRGEHDSALHRCDKNVTNNGGIRRSNASQSEASSHRDGSDTIFTLYPHVVDTSVHRTIFWQHPWNTNII